jgi:hypothetical protein
MGQKIRDSGKSKESSAHCSVSKQMTNAKTKISMRGKQNGKQPVAVMDTTVYDTVPTQVVTIRATGPMMEQIKRALYAAIVGDIRGQFNGTEVQILGYRCVTITSEATGRVQNAEPLTGFPYAVFVEWKSSHFIHLLAILIKGCGLPENSILGIGYTTRPNARRKKTNPEQSLSVILASLTILAHLLSVMPQTTVWRNLLRLSTLSSVLGPPHVVPGILPSLLPFNIGPVDSCRDICEHHWVVVLESSNGPFLADVGSS